MAFTKSVMQEQLALFIHGFASSVDRVLSTNLSEEVEDDGRVKATTLWAVADTFYEYGVKGVPSHGLGSGHTIDAALADVELFLNHIENLDPYLYEDNVILPHYAKRAARTAIARHVLEGGERYSFSNEDEVGYLGLAEIALLADMDEKSVRNATNNKNPDPLKTETIGKRSMVSIAEARRWLAGRKGFVPTQIELSDPVPAVTTIDLPKETAELLAKKAEEAGLTIGDFIACQLATQ